jgi:hypothetical protein
MGGIPIVWYLSLLIASLIVADKMDDQLKTRILLLDTVKDPCLSELACILFTI